MMYPITQEEYDQWNMASRIPPEEVIKRCTNFLIIMLYRPDQELGYVLDHRRVQELVRRDLGAVVVSGLECTSVERCGEAFVAHVEEASPDAYKLKEYLETWLHKWGWPVVVELEW